MSDRLLPTLLLVLLALVIFWAMRSGWKKRIERQQETTLLAEVPESYQEASSQLAVPGVYVATTSLGDWLDRIATNTLGVKAKGTFFVFEDAAIIARDGAQDLYIPASSILAVRTESGMSGKFLRGEGLVVVSWTLDKTPVDTGFKTQFAADQESLLAALRALAPQALDRLP